MPKTKLIRDRGASRPRLLKGPFGTVTFTAPEQNSKTWAVGPTGVRGLLEYGPSVPGPFGEVVGLIDESKVVFRYLPWGSVESGRHAFQVRYEGAEYILVSRGRRRPVPTLEAVDGRVLATFAGSGTAADELTVEEVILVALIAGSELASVTMPQSWAARH
jgi:hypothetical protein